MITSQDQGSDAADTMLGEAGDDRIEVNLGVAAIADGGSDDDFICGRDLDDTLMGGIGSDVVRGGAGDDLINGGGAPDEDGKVVAGSFADDSAADSVLGGQGDDTIMAGVGDVVETGSGMDDVAVMAPGNAVTAGGTVTVTDFELGMDRLLVMVPAGTGDGLDQDDILDGQTLSDDGLTLSLPNGSAIFLAGLTSELTGDDIALVQEEGAPIAA